MNLILIAREGDKAGPSAAVSSPDIHTEYTSFHSDARKIEPCIILAGKESAASCLSKRCSRLAYTQSTRYQALRIGSLGHNRFIVPEWLMHHLPPLPTYVSSDTQGTTGKSFASLGTGQGFGDDIRCKGTRGREMGGGGILMIVGRCL